MKEDCVEIILINSETNGPKLLGVADEDAQGREEDAKINLVKTPLNLD
jgi:hypothetical protein